MKLQQLQVLVAVVDQGGIRAAARMLGLSQAALTKAMRLLEEEAGTGLLLRRATGIGLTPAGERLLTRARVVTRQVALAQEELQQAAGDLRGTLRVGVTPFLSVTALGPAFRWFRQRYPQVQLQLIEGLVGRVLPRLREGTLDLAAVAADAGELRGDALQQQALGTVAQRVVVRAGHPVLSDPTPAALAALEWVLTQPLQPGSTPALEAMFNAAGVGLPQQVIVCETLAAMTLLRHSDAASLFPLPLLGQPESRGIVAVDVPALQPPAIDLLLLTRADLPLTPAAAYFAHCLAQVAQEDGPHLQDLAGIAHGARTDAVRDRDDRF